MTTDTLQTIAESIKDTVYIGSNPELISAYEKLIDSQSQTYNIILIVFIAIVSAFAGLTFWWNKRGLKKYIDREIDNKMIKKEIEISKKLKKTINEDIEKKLTKHENRILFLEADVARALAASSESFKYHTVAIYWWAKALNIYVDMKSGTSIRAMVNVILHAIEAIKKDEKTEKTKGQPNKQNLTLFDSSEHKEILKIANKIPDILEKEKQSIIKNIKDRVSTQNKIQP